MAHRSLTPHLKPHQRIILPWDQNNFNDSSKAKLGELLPHVGMIKLGYQAIYTRSLQSTIALDVVRYLELVKCKYFLDAKLKDIQNTVVEASKAILSWPRPPRIITIHATMRFKTIIAALEATRGTDVLIAGVSLLTDHDEGDATDIYDTDPQQVVVDCARRLKNAVSETGIPCGLVCAPRELLLVDRFEELIKITPNIRAADSPPDDQNKSRSMTPAEAIKAGADYLVIGRPIMNAPNPVAAAQKIGSEIANLA